MPEPNNRRISIRPVFDPFELLDDEARQPLSTNGYRADSLDEDANLFAGLHLEPIDPSGADSAGNGNGKLPHAAPYNTADGNGAAAHRPGFTTIIAANGAVHGRFNHSADRIADELENDPDIADLIAAKAAFAMSEPRQVSHEQQPPESNGDAHHFDAPVNGDAQRNGDAPFNGDAQRNGDAPHPASEPIAVESNGESNAESNGESNGESAAEPLLADRAANDFLYVQNPSADYGHSESNGAPVETQPDAPLELAPTLDVSELEVPPVADEPPPALEESPPIVQDDQVETVDDSTAPPASDSDVLGSQESHPARSSLFVPYLVTEIRELRNRSRRGKSWWRRLFG